MVKFQAGQVLIMPWLKVNDQQHCNQKVLRAWIKNPAAMGLWLMGATWSADNMTDGFVPEHVVEFMRGGELAEVLVECGLWDAVEGGYLISGFLDHNPTREATLQKRERKRAAGSKGGKATAQKRRGSKPVAGAARLLGEGAQQTGSPNPNPNPNLTAATQREGGARRKDVSGAGFSAKELRTRRRLGLEDDLIAWGAEGEPEGAA